VHSTPPEDMETIRCGGEGHVPINLGSTSPPENLGLEGDWGGGPRWSGGKSTRE